METNSRNIYQCLAAILLSVKAVSKDKKNAQQNFLYRGIDDIMNSLHASFAVEGVVIRLNEIRTIERAERPTKSGGTMLYSINDYQFCLSAPDGTYVMAWSRGEASDSADKSSNKAVSVALKYCLLQMFLIPTEEMAANEADAYTNELGTKQKVASASKEAAMPEQYQSEFEQACDILNSYANIADVVAFWQQQSDDGPAKMFVTFAKAFFDAAARCSHTPNDLGEFWSATPKKWQQSERLVKILSTRKTEITNATS